MDASDQYAIIAYFGSVDKPSLSFNFFVQCIPKVTYSLAIMG